MEVNPCQSWFASERERERRMGADLKGYRFALRKED